MNHFSKYFTLLLFSIFSIAGFGQDTLRTTFKDFSDIQKKAGIYRIDDIFQDFHKLSVWDDHKTEYIYIGEMYIKLDTSIYYDSSNLEQFQGFKNASLFLQYYGNNILSPPHGGDPNHAIVSFVVDENGELETVRILEDVKNRLCEGEWEITIDRDYGFEPLIINGRSYLTEYVIKVMDLQFCIPLIEKSSEVKY